MIISTTLRIQTQFSTWQSHEGRTTQKEWINSHEQYLKKLFFEIQATTEQGITHWLTGLKKTILLQFLSRALKLNVKNVKCKCKTMF